MVEFWRAGGSVIAKTIPEIQKVEAEGWDGQAFMDSQSIGADPYVMMGFWAAATKHLKFSTGVTNPLTRHPAVTAGSMAALQMVSGGRAVLGLGRGDSALAHLGFAPVNLPAFERAMNDFQTLLSGGEVAFGAHETFIGAASSEKLSLGDRPAATKLEWLPKDLPKVPLDVAATGPKVIEMSAPIAERVTFSVGAIPERIDWALGLARAAREKHELTDHGISYGAQIIVVCHPDMEFIRPIATSFAAPLARFQVIQGAASGPQNASDVENFAKIRGGYDMTKHGHTISHDKIKGATLSWDFVERFVVVGPPERCIERLLQLHAAGIDRFVVVGPGFHPEATSDGSSLFASEVMPAVRATLKS